MLFFIVLQIEKTTLKNSVKCHVKSIRIFLDFLRYSDVVGVIIALLMGWIAKSKDNKGYMKSHVRPKTY